MRVLVVMVWAGVGVRLLVVVGVLVVGGEVRVGGQV